MKQSDIFAVPIDTDDSRRRVVLQSDLEGGLLGLRFVPPHLYRFSVAHESLVN